MIRPNPTGAQSRDSRMRAASKKKKKKELLYYTAVMMLKKVIQAGTVRK